jgi:Holliday junction resolvase RusA-like endonuclease
MYINNRRRGKGRIKSPKARTFEKSAALELRAQWSKKDVSVRINGAYFLLLVFWFERVRTKGYARGRAKYPWKRQDVGNYRKALEDAVFDVLGIDDLVVMDSMQCRREDPENPRVDIYLYELK